MIGKPNRPGFSTITPYLMVPEVGPVVDFLENAFGAEETFWTTGGERGYWIRTAISGFSGGITLDKWLL